MRSSARSLTPPWCSGRRRAGISGSGWRSGSRRRRSSLRRGGRSARRSRYAPVSYISASGRSPHRAYRHHWLQFWAQTVSRPLRVSISLFQRPQDSTAALQASLAQKEQTFDVLRQALTKTMAEKEALEAMAEQEAVEKAAMQRERSNLLNQVRWAQLLAISRAAQWAAIQRNCFREFGEDRWLYSTSSYLQVEFAAGCQAQAEQAASELRTQLSTIEEQLRAARAELDAKDERLVHLEGGAMWACLGPVQRRWQHPQHAA